MKKILPIICLFFLSSEINAQCEKPVIPFNRVRFHDRIKEEQVKCDKADGKLDSLIRVGNNEEINLQVTDAFNRKIKDILCFIETSTSIPSNNEKIRQLNYVEEVVRVFRTNWKA